MSGLPGDQSITKLFGFPGFEALIRITLKYINELRDEQGKPPITYEEFRTEIETQKSELEA